MSDGELQEILKKARENFNISASAGIENPTETASVTKKNDAVTGEESISSPNIKPKSTSDCQKSPPGSIRGVSEKTLGTPKNGILENCISKGIANPRKKIGDSVTDITKVMESMESRSVASSVNFSGIERNQDKRIAGKTESKWPASSASEIQKVQNSRQTAGYNSESMLAASSANGIHENGLENGGTNGESRISNLDMCEVNNGIMGTSDAPIDCNGYGDDHEVPDEVFTDTRTPSEKSGLEGSEQETSIGNKVQKTMKDKCELPFIRVVDLF